MKKKFHKNLKTHYIEFAESILKNWKLWLTVIATLLAIIVSGIVIYDRLVVKNNMVFLEQSIDPDVLRDLREKGLDVRIEKGITITPIEPGGTPDVQD
jgi:hypothetical protein